MTMSRIHYGRVAACVIAALTVTGIFYLWLAGAGLPDLAALTIAMLFAVLCVGFTFWNLGLRLTQDR